MLKIGVRLSIAAPIAIKCSSGKDLGARKRQREGGAGVKNA